MGPEFSDLRPISWYGTYEPLEMDAYSYGGLCNGVIYPVVSASAPNLNCFREGETLLVYLEVNFPALVVGQDTPVYVSALRILPRWLRSAVEFRTTGTGNSVFGAMGGLVAPAGAPFPAQIDTDSFGGWNVADEPFGALQFDAINVLAATAGGGAGLGNRSAWMEMPKRLDTVPFSLGSAPFNVAADGNSDSVFLSEVWRVDLPNPTSAPWNAAPWNTPGPDAARPPAYSVNRVFVVPTYGRALGVSFESVLSYVSNDALVPYPGGGGQPVPPGAKGGIYPRVRIGYRAGATNSVVQEQIG